MKRLFVFLIAISCIGSVFAKRTYWYNDAYFNTYAIGVGYSHFNEHRVSSVNDFKAHQINMFAVIYGVYIDGTIAPSQYSPSDNQNLGNWGMSFGYIFPLMKRNSTEFRLYAGPVVGFQNVGCWYRTWDRYYIRDYGCGYSSVCYNYETTAFHKYDSYFDVGGVIAVSYKNLWVQFKATKTTLSGSVGFCF